MKVFLQLLERQKKGELDDHILNTGVALSGPAFDKLTS